MEGVMKAAIYYRVSTSTQKEKHSIESQKAILPKFVKDSGWELTGEYTDEGISGSFIKGRGDFIRLLGDAEENKFNILVVIEFSRITRSTDPTERALIIKTLKEHDIKIASPTDGLQSVETLDDELMVYLKQWYAAKESSAISERMKRGKKSKLLDNQYVLPSILFGLQKETIRDSKGKIVEHKLVLHPEESQTLRKIYTWIVKDGLSLIEVSARLNEKGIKTKRGKKWGPSNLSSLLRQENSLQGKIICNRRRQKLIGSENGTNKFQKLPDFDKDEWIEVKAPKIFTKQEYDTLRKKIKANFVERVKKPDDDFILRGLLTCGICGGGLHCRHGGINRGTRYYVCGKKLVSSKLKTERCDNAPWVNAKKIESLVESRLITNLLRDPAKTMQEFNQAEENKGKIEKLESKLNRIDKEIEKISSKEERLLEFTLNDVGWSKEVLAKKSEQLKTQRADLEEEKLDVLELLRLSEKKQSNQDQLIEAETDIKKFGKGLIRKIEGMSVSEKQKLFRLFLGDSAKVVIDESFQAKQTISKAHLGESGKARGPIVMGWRLEGTLNLAEIIRALKAYSVTGKLPEPYELNKNYFDNLSRYLFMEPMIILNHNQEEVTDETR
ncbi:MAG: recombinase family protein [Desulfatiglandaceae bacterium]